jgi:hypothetical protein
MVQSFSSSAGLNPKLFYGWLIVAVSTLAMLITNSLAVGGLPVFFKPLMTDLGITDRSVLATAAITFLISGGFSPIVGDLIGRVNLTAFPPVKRTNSPSKPRLPV